MPLPPDYELFGSLNAFSGGTADSLRECWDGTAYNLDSSERAALWYAYALSQSVQAALEWPQFLSLRELWSEATVGERYVFQSAIHMIHRNLPFSATEMEILASEHNQDDYAFESRTISDHQPELVERWHGWIWSDEEGTPQTQVQFMGASALLAESCARLYQISGKGHRDISRRHTDPSL
ncbi:MAG: hypothetical protein WBQ21_13445 [Solirubrobacteraceae bacterium]